MKTLESIYLDILHSDSLQTRMIDASLQGTLEEFFRSLGCETTQEEIWNYFRQQVMTSGELTDQELEVIAGGSGDRRPLLQLLRIWVRHVGNHF